MDQNFCPYSLEPSYGEGTTLTTVPTYSLALLYLKTAIIQKISTPSTLHTVKQGSQTYSLLAGYNYILPADTFESGNCDLNASVSGKSEQMKKRKCKTSSIWLHFNDTGDSKAECRIYKIRSRINDTWFLFFVLHSFTLWFQTYPGLKPYVLPSRIKSIKMRLLWKLNKNCFLEKDLSYCSVLNITCSSIV